MNICSRMVLGFIAAVVLALGFPALAGWTEERRLTFRQLEINPQIIATGDTLHLGWGQIAGDDFASYARSLDGGETWDQIMNLTDPAHSARRPVLSVSSGLIFLGWFDEYWDGYHSRLNVAYAFSPGGGDWSETRYAFDEEVDFFEVVTALSRDTIYIVYCSDEPDSTGNYPLVFLRSPDLGQSWSNHQTIGYARGNITGWTQMGACNGSLHFVWSSFPVPEGRWIEVLVRSSRDGGLNWGDRKILSTYGEYDAQTPCLVCNKESDDVLVAWMDHGFPGDLFLRITTDGGDNWGPEIQVTDHPGVFQPYVEFCGDTLWAVWTDYSFADSGNWVLPKAQTAV